MTTVNNNSYWCKSTCDNRGRELTFEDSDGFWRKWTRNEFGQTLTYEDSLGRKDENFYDSRGNLIGRR